MLNSACAINKFTGAYQYYIFMFLSVYFLPVFVIVGVPFSGFPLLPLNGMEGKDLTLNVSTLLAYFASASCFVSAEIRRFNLSRSPSIL